MKKPEVLERGMSLKEILERAQNQPFTYFKKYPIDEVREACVKKLLSTNDVNSGQYVGWAEWAIDELIRQEKDELAEKILSWYIFKAGDDETRIRALKFAIGLHRGMGTLCFWNSSVISKLIHGCLLKERNERIYLYNKIPLLPDFLKKLLGELKRGKYYNEAEWCCADRALRIIARAKDFDFINFLELLLKSFNKSEIEPCNFSDPFARAKHIASIADAISKVRSGK